MPKNKNKTGPYDIYYDPYSDDPTRQQRARKRVVAFLIFIGIVSVGFGIWYIASEITGPFKTNVELAEVASSSFGSSPARIESLREKDTDGDGVTDYDELYHYQTSPYIGDSDSDGLSDKAEIESNTDPNCPRGDVCGREITTAANANTNTNIAAGTNDILSVLQPDATTNTNAAAADLENLTPGQLRSILRGAGASEELLSQVDDSDLMKTYEELLEAGDIGQNADAATNTGITPTDSYAITYETLKNMEAPEIRDFLVESGISADTLNQVDDDTLKSIFQQSLTENVPATTTTNTNQ